MGMSHFGPKHLVEAAANKLQAQDTSHLKNIIETLEKDKLDLTDTISSLESKISTQKKEIIEVIKEIPVEVIKEVKVYREKFVEVPVIREVERIIEREVPVIREFPVIKEVFVDRPIEVIKEIEKQIKYIPVWIYGVLAAQTLSIIILLLK